MLRVRAGDDEVTTVIGNPVTGAPVTGGAEVGEGLGSRPRVIAVGCDLAIAALSLLGTAPWGMARRGTVLR